MTSLTMLLAQQSQERAKMKTCKHCDREIKWNVALQRYEHADTHHDACTLTFEDDGKRAEPKDG